ncbi:dienelactone hydrolase family protein [Georgenia thermotolerans]|uniref:Dienelactone hydrolase family protein n=1 Tax=Georgenia thermotolerans TaxID=527326 RepID=A0A7J5URX0_9MICO|nr:dienelactone hydrolase family protein [Georgenia thermotolerans]KAE8764884.1 dienelactone hydrolase family protein [Georgenia thermotolerans]
MAEASVSVTVPTAKGEMPAHLWLPPSGTGPGIVVLQEIFGVSRYIQDRCADLAELGYVVLAPEIYWRIGSPELDESRPDYLEQGLALMQHVEWDDAVADGVAALRALRERPEVVGGVGVLGFCYGGGLAFHVAAAADPDVLVSYYGSALPRLLELAPRVSAPSLHHFGTDDAYIPMPQVEAIRDAVAGPDVEFHLYPGAGHAFDNPLPMFHHPEAADDAWSATTRFLHAHLPAQEHVGRPIP